MSLRRLQRRSAALLLDGGLLQALRAELAHELSSSPPPLPPPPFSLQTHHGSNTTVSEFAVEWDGPRASDVVLRLRAAPTSSSSSAAAAAEVAVSAVLAPLRLPEDDLPPPPRDALMKVCVKKPHLRPVLRFDCRVFWRREEFGDSDFSVKGVYYHPSVGSCGDCKYKGPVFSSLDPQLQEALKQYLASRGINTELTNFLLQHLQRKEHAQYVNWLRALESAFAKDA
ncbi:Mitochondrial acidic protein MAM33 [Ananas comosus]|uniref:Mitochondrial acidic protein MAM33 n=1 Tax=Ananas comosus TaxID=4615 RepID=A0A199W355_ANACO|nr:Mitochondrial acidic protein MAM33 [Ananas comosus]